MQRFPLPAPVWTHSKQQAIKSAGEKKRIGSMMQFDTLLNDRHLNRRPRALTASHECAGKITQHYDSGISFPRDAQLLDSALGKYDSTGNKADAEEHAIDFGGSCLFNA